MYSSGELREKKIVWYVSFVDKHMKSNVIIIVLIYLVITMRRQSLNVFSTRKINKMEVLSSVESLSHKTIKQKFMRWASKWYYADIVDENPEKPDVTLLICLLQSIGFQLQQFEKSNDKDTKLNDNNNSINIIIECGSSKMKAILKLDDVRCQCPNPQDASDASFWSVTGSAPTGSMDNINKYVETGSNLLPQFSKDSYRVIHDIIHSVLNIIKNKVDTNHDTEDNTSTSSFERITKDYYETYKTLKTPETFARCYTQPEMSHSKYIEHNASINKSDNTDNLIIDAGSEWNFRKIPIVTTPETSDKPSPTLLRQVTYDAELKKIEDEKHQFSRPSKIMSSPATCPDLVASFSEISLQSNNGSLTLLECLKRAKFYIEKAQHLQTPKLSSSVLSENISKTNTSHIKPGVHSKILRANSQILPKLAFEMKTSPGNKLSQNSIKKVISRRSVRSASSITGRISINPPKTSNTGFTTTAPITISKNPSTRRQTLGESSQALQLAVDDLRCKNSTTKIGSLRTKSSTNLGSNSSILSKTKQSQVIKPVKKTVVSSEKNKSPSQTFLSNCNIQNKLFSAMTIPTNGMSSHTDVATHKSSENLQEKFPENDSDKKKINKSFTKTQFI